jgi:anaerobic magnesium-protoporphyrin IX monomethyl ester cyclase
MKILFANAFFMAFDTKQRKAAMPYPPLATLYAAAVAEKDGHTVALFDTTFCLPKDIEEKIKSFQPDILVIYDDNFNYITKMCLRNMRHAAFDMAKIAKAHNCITIANSSDASDHYEDYLKNNLDYIIIGEGEITLHELLSSIQNKKEINHLNGIAYNKDNATILTPKRLTLKDPDQLPMPLFHLVNWAEYKNTWQKNHGYFSINLVTTRGCPYKCNWCAKPIFGQRYNVHSVEKTIQEIKHLQQLVNFDHIWFCDDIFGLKPEWIAAFNAGLKKEGIKIRYKIQSRADLLLNETYVKDLAESGCEEIWMGVESGSQKILDAMDKGTTIAEIKTANALLKQYKIKSCFFIQYGYLEENKDDILLTLNIIDELKPHDIGVSVSYPMPGTKFYEKVKNNMTEKKNWDDTNDFEIMYNATYPSDFYRHLQLYTHKKFRIDKEQKNLSENIKSVYHYFGMLYHKNKVNQYERFIS